MIEHHIQRDIVNELMYHACLRFSELKPDGMESNIFMYHLNQLIKGGYVEKFESGYRLAPMGLQYVDGISSVSLKPRKQPKIIAIVALENQEGKWLLAERKIQPYIGERMFPSGKQHLGESFSEHARRELREKIGHEVSLRFRGIAEIIIYRDGQVLTQVLAHVHSGKLDESEPPAASDRFSYVWHDFDKDEHQLMAGTKELHEALCQEADRPFMIELVV